MLMTDLRVDLVQTAIARTDRMTSGAMMEILMRLEREALDYFEHERIGPDRIVPCGHCSTTPASGCGGAAAQPQVVPQRLADMRYLGQEHTVRVPLPGGELSGDSMREIEENFGGLHEQHYTFRLDTSSPVEFVNFHLTAFGTVEKPGLRRLEPDGTGASQARKGEREVDFDELGRHRSAVYERALLGAGAQVDGPAVVEEPAASTVLFPGDRLTVDDYGNLIIEVEI